MKYTRTAVGIQHWFGFSSILQGYDISGKVYALVSKVDAVRETINGWASRSAGRKELSKLNAHQLRDIGLEPFEVQREINKPFWVK